MQRLYAKPDTTIGGKRQQRSNSLLNISARSGEIAISRRTTDQHQHISTERHSLLDSPTIIVQLLAPTLLSWSTEPATTAQAGDLQTSITHNTSALLQPGFRHFMTP